MFGFDKDKRLLKKNDYDHVFKQSNKLVTSEFILFFCKNDIGHARLGLALSKKTIAKAHDRNRLKRLLRETFRCTLLPAVDIVVLARNGTSNMPNSVIIPRLGKTWNKLSILCKN